MQHPRAPVEKKPIDWGELLRKIAVLLTKWGGLAFIVCLCYFAYAIFGGVLQNASAARAEYLIHSFGLGLFLSALALSLGIVLLTLDELAYSIVVGIGGAVLMLGIPYLVAGHLSTTSLSQDMQGAVRALSGWGTQSGMVVLVVVGGRILFEIYLQMRMAPERRRQRAEKEQLEEGGLKKHKTLKPASILSRCWELPFCHERIREICPAFKARKACWRYGIGCNCDPKMIESLIRMGQPGRGPAPSSEMQARQAAYIRSDLQADVAVGDRARRTIPCSRCPIYNEHQRLKFKFINPVAIIATFVIMGVLYVPIMQILTAIAKGIAQIAANISINQRVDAGQWFEYLNTPGVKIFFFLILGLLALSYVLKFTEWVVLEKKL